MQSACLQAYFTGIGLATRAEHDDGRSDGGSALLVFQVHSEGAILILLDPALKIRSHQRGPSLHYAMLEDMVLQACNHFPGFT